MSYNSAYTKTLFTSSWSVIKCVKLKTSKDVMFYVAEMIPKLKTRTQKSGGGDTSSQQGEGGKKSKKKKK
uniref:Uncharacterized protein n=1 Tax=Seriola lalandi dorsalis TaxID=1841481 RepID=A0A3B4WNH4_SERLL